MPSVIDADTAARVTPAKTIADAFRVTSAIPESNHATATIDEIVNVIIIAGGCILRNAVSSDDLADIETETRPYMQIDSQDLGSEFYTSETRRVCGIASKSKAITTTLIGHEKLQAVADRFLTSRFGFWVGDDWKESVSRPVLSNAGVFAILPGGRAQGLHRDDMIYHNACQARTPAEYQMGQDVGIGFLIAGKKSTRQNGATRLIPGSHLWDNARRPDESLAVYAELKPGDALIFLPSVFHGGSANTSVDEERLLYSFFMIKGFLRQEENQYLTHDLQKLQEMYDDSMLERLGYNISAPFLGRVDHKHPLDFFRGTNTTTDIY